MAEVKPTPRTLQSLVLVANTDNQELLLQHLVDAVHELNGRIQFLNTQVQTLSTAVSVPVDTLKD